MERGLTQRLDGVYKSSNSEDLVQKEYKTIHEEAYIYTVRGIKKLSSTGTGTDTDTGTDMGAIDNM